MMPRRRETLFAIGLASLRTLFCAYAAFHQSITIDEAFTSNMFVNRVWSDLWKYYDPNNHILYSILARLSVALFGKGEFALRLPSVLAGFFFVLGVYSVLRVTESRAIRWVFLVAICLNPMLLDFSVAARGYGLCVALLVWAIYLAMKARYFASGILAGLAVCANLVGFFAVGALCAAVALSGAGWWKTRLRNAAMMMAIVGGMVFALYYVPLRDSSGHPFPEGAAQLSAAIRVLTALCVRGSDRDGILGSTLAMRALQFVVLPAVWIMIVAAILRCKRSERWIPLLVTIVYALEVFGLKLFLRVGYPFDRTALPMIAMLGIAWAIAADALRGMRMANIAMGSLFIVQGLTQLHTDYLYMWRDMSNTREIARHLNEATAGRPAGSVHATAGPRLKEAMNFYRLLLPMKQLAEIPWEPVTPLTGRDVYVFDGENIAAGAARGKRVLFQAANAVIAVDR